MEFFVKHKRIGELPSEFYSGSRHANLRPLSKNTSWVPLILITLTRDIKPNTIDLTDLLANPIDFTDLPTSNRFCGFMTEDKFDVFIKPTYRDIKSCLVLAMDFI